jgi:hypothetical protein
VHDKTSASTGAVLALHATAMVLGNRLHQSQPQAYPAVALAGPVAAVKGLKYALLFGLRHTGATVTYFYLYPVGTARCA